MRIESAAPPTVRGAGALVGLQGLGGLGFAVALLVGGDTTTDNRYGEAGYFALIGAAVLACGVALVLGKRGARAPATVVEILLLGVAWYAMGPSSRPEYGFPVGLLSVLVLYLLYNARARAWAQDLPEDADRNPD